METDKQIKEFLDKEEPNLQKYLMELTRPVRRDVHLTPLFYDAAARTSSGRQQQIYQCVAQALRDLDMHEVIIDGISELMEVFRGWALGNGDVCELEASYSD